MYQIDYTENSIKDVAKLKKSEPHAYKKLSKLLDELKEHPTFGTGHPKPLGENRVNQWSRKITAKHRLVYTVEDETVTVLVLSAYGHYGDK